MWKVRARRSDVSPTKIWFQLRLDGRLVQGERYDYIRIGLGEMKDWKVVAVDIAYEATASDYPREALQQGLFLRKVGVATTVLAWNAWKGLSECAHRGGSPEAAVQ